jgi:DNA-binding MarR family transcriptional regulator
MKDPLTHFPGYALRRASNASMAAFARALEPLSMRISEATTLMFIAANPGISQARLGAALDIQSANMTPLLTRLEGQGLIKRMPLDGRTNGLHLTDVGVKLADSVEVTIAHHESALLDRVPVEHRPHLVAALKALWTD